MFFYALFSCGIILLVFSYKYFSTFALCSRMSLSRLGSRVGENMCDFMGRSGMIKDCWVLDAYVIFL